MRYIIYGAGALGGIIGSRLHQHAREVVLVCRGRHLDAIRQNGLTVNDAAGSSTVAMSAVEHLSDIRFAENDLLVLATRTQETEAALIAISAAGGNELPIACCQNGVENERRAARWFDRVYPVAVWIRASHLEPGVVSNSTVPGVGAFMVGRYPKGEDDVTSLLIADLEGAGFHAEGDQDVMRWKYLKLLGNLENALEAICGLGADSADLQRTARMEALMCYKAAGITFAPKVEFDQRIAPFAQPAATSDAATGMSTWQGMMRGLGTSEVDYLNGEIVMLGRLHGVKTPVNLIIQRVMNEMVRERRRPGSTSVADLRDMLKTTTS